ncbi:MAG: hypothetical protein ABSH49_24245 [Bryobacteraceae bacterium]|jgi:hypothetical protein
MIHRNMLLAIGFAIAAPFAIAQSKTPQTIAFPEPACRFAPAVSDLSPFVDVNTGTILTASSALDLIAALMNSNTQTCDPPISGPSYVKRQFHSLVDSSFGEPGKTLDRKKLDKAVFILHVLRWTDAAQTGNPPTVTQTVQQQQWYLIDRGKFVRPGRLFGAKTVYFVYLHLNKNSRTDYTSNYNLTITEAIPQNQQNLQLLASLLASGAANGSSLGPVSVWGGMELDMWYSTADIEIDSSTTDNKQPGAKSVALDNPVKIHNEGLGWWDVSAGVPIRKMSQLTFQSSSNTLTPQTVDKKSIFALMDFYPLHKQKMDLAYSNFTWIPSFVAGVPVTEQPLHQPLFGLAWGPRFVQFYFGAIIRKQPNLPTGSILAPGTSACSGWCPQFAFGINLPIKALQTALSSKPPASGGNGNSQQGAQAPATTSK